MPTYADLDALLEKFDFQKVHKVMTLLDWQWSGQGVPSVENMKSTVSYLFSILDRENKSDASTGGFKLERHRDKLVLTFQLEWMTHYVSNLQTAR